MIRRCLFSGLQKYGYIVARFTIYKLQITIFLVISINYLQALSMILKCLLLKKPKIVCK